MLLDCSTPEPSVSSLGQHTHNATGKHTSTQLSNGITLGAPDMTCGNGHVIDSPLPLPVPDVTTDQDQAVDQPGLRGGESGDDASLGDQARS